jgi:hypothetical protein
MQSVGHIQTTREIFQPNKKARALERRCIVSQYYSLGPIFEGETNAVHWTHTNHPGSFLT